MANTQLEKYRRIAKTLKNPTPVELPSGKFRCQVTVDGHRESIVDEDPRVAHAQAVAMRANLIEAQKKPRVVTLLCAIDEYISLKEGVLSPSTIRGYEIVKRNRFQELMDVNVHDIKKSHMQAAINREAKTVSPKTVYNAYGLIRPVLKEYGVEFSGIALPQRIKPIKRYMQETDIGKLLEEIQGDSCEVPILLAVWLGLRRSEIIGLCWDCVDFEQSVIHIRKTYVPDKDNNWVLKPGAKNESSQRSVKCPAYIMDKLRNLPRDSDGQIFKLHPDTLRRHIHLACERAGITDTTIHGLRHTNAAVMKGLGVSDGHAMARGGWTDETTYKKTYSYVFDNVADADDARINSFFENKIAHESAHGNKET